MSLYPEKAVKNHPRNRQNGCVYEHHLVAEEKLGRYLLPEECVHHVDKNKFNNHPDNLMVFATRSDHNRFHKNGVAILINNGSYISPIIKKYNCLICGKPSNTPTCSHKCAAIHNRKVERPTKEELKELIQIESFCAIGRRYGVSDKAVSKWCKSYDLPYRKKDM